MCGTGSSFRSVIASPRSLVTQHAKTAQRLDGCGRSIQCSAPYLGQKVPEMLPATCFSAKKMANATPAELHKQQNIRSAPCRTTGHCHPNTVESLHPSRSPWDDSMNWSTVTSTGRLVVRDPSDWILIEIPFPDWHPPPSKRRLLSTWTLQTYITLSNTSPSQRVC